MILSKATIVLLRMKKVATVVVSVIEGILKVAPPSPIKPLRDDQPKD